MNIEELEARVKEAKGRLQEIDGLATKEGRDLNEDERGEWNKLNEQIEADKVSLEERRARLERIEELGEDPAHRDEPSPQTFQTRRPDVVRGDEIWDLSTVRSSAAGPQSMTRELAERGKRAIERCVPAHESVTKEDAQTHLERLQDQLDGRDGAFSRHLLITGSPTYREAWVKAMGGAMLTPEEQRSLNLTGEEGGYLLPYTLDPTVIPASVGVRNPLRSISRNVQTTTNVWKGVTSTGMTARWREAEGEEAEDNSPKFKQPEIICHAADSFAQWTYEFGQDYGSIAGEVAGMVSDAKDVQEAETFLEGSGEKEPYGINTGTEVETVESAAEKAFSVADVYNLEAKPGPRYTTNASFVGHKAIFNLIRQFAETDGPELWIRLGEGFQRRADGALGEGLLGYPTYELSTMEPKVTQNKFILFFGDFKVGYIIADRIGMFSKPISDITGEEGRPTGESGLYFFWRTGARVSGAAGKLAISRLKIK